MTIFKAILFTQFILTSCSGGSSKEPATTEEVTICECKIYFGIIVTKKIKQKQRKKEFNYL
jgi:hypothetical protein